MRGIAAIISPVVVTVVLAVPPAGETVEEITAYNYEPNPTEPFGKRNPSAPVELAQFEFLIGEHSCIDELTDLNGKTTRLEARWSGKFILNGYGIQDSYWNEVFSTTNVRVFDQQQRRWHVTYFKQPSLKSGVWMGGAKGRELILKRMIKHDGQSAQSRLTFRNITLTSFTWISEYIADDIRYVNWVSKCQRATFPVDTMDPMQEIRRSHVLLSISPVMLGA